jgi:AcrR family transcriptional regulator
MGASRTEGRRQRLPKRMGRPPRSGPHAREHPLHTLAPEDRRTLVLETAARLFATKGFASTTIEDITEALGVSKAVFYYYWNNKREVLREIHRRAVEVLNQRLEAVASSSLSPAERVAALVKNHIDVIIRHRALVLVLLGEATAAEDTLEDRRRYTRRVQELLEAAQAAGAIDPSYDPKILSFALLGLCNSVAQWYDPSGPLPPAAIEELFARLALSGVYGAAQSTPDTLRESTTP